MKSLSILSILGASAILFSGCSSSSERGVKDEKSDDTLHLLAPQYPMTYGVPSKEQVKAKMDTVLAYLIESTPLRVVTPEGEVVEDYSQITSKDAFDGKFRLSSYEWGVTYSAMLAAAQATGDEAYAQYAKDRLNYMYQLYPYLKEAFAKEGTLHPVMIKMVDPRALDDGGAICSAMMKYEMADSTVEYGQMIENYFDYVINKEHRLGDGTFARNRPQHNTVWLDDMFMGIPSLAVRGAWAKDSKMYDEATKQVKQFAQRMWVPEKQLFRHGWVESMDYHPSFFWGRANGWAILTMCEVLDYLPENHPDRAFIIDLLQKHAQGLASRQGNDGLWHQLLDREDTYGETSATAIYTYALAHAINKGWLDAKAFGPVALLGWNALADHIQSNGEITGTCVGTGMGFDPAFYAYRPVSTKAAHIYGPTIWAGAEIINLINHQYPQSNDSAVQFYDNDPQTDHPIFQLDENNIGHLVQ